jgi:hypothetical protein
MVAAAIHGGALVIIGKMGKVLKPRIPGTEFVERMA